MSRELIKCPCCEKMVPANDVELVYRKPDAIASMNEDEIDDSCKYTDDYFVFDDKYFYLRCVIPLPVHDTGREYSIGAWAQVSEKGFQKVWDLWDEDDQSSEPPIKGLLANNIHLNGDNINSEVLVQLTGAKSRPVIRIKDENISLYNEQVCGITIHRASEYSDLCRK